MLVSMSMRRMFSDAESLTGCGEVLFLLSVWSLGRLSSVESVSVVNAFLC